MVDAASLKVGVGGTAPLAAHRLVAYRRVLLFPWLLTLLLQVVWAAPPDLLLAETYRADSVNLSRYLVSEKLDGVRAYWDGRQLWTRGGNPISAPHWFVVALPPQPLDGELWQGRGRFDDVSAAIRRDAPRDAEWQPMRYMLFELPGAAGDFAARAAALRAIAQRAAVPWLQAVAQTPVTDAVALQQRLQQVLTAGGEGLMLHRADAPYVTGRSDVLLKVTVWHTAEAVVIAHLPGKGRHAGALGALRMRVADGREFSLGTGFSDTERRHPPPIGATVTYRYRELTAKGLPRFARFWRVRQEE